VGKKTCASTYMGLYLNVCLWKTALQLRLVIVWFCGSSRILEAGKLMGN
jgi:hypothetical protein